eukprot:24520-Pyramimonas_sp.AAC.1
MFNRSVTLTQPSSTKAVIHPEHPPIPHAVRISNSARWVTPQGAAGPSPNTPDVPSRSPASGNDDQPITPGVGQGSRARSFEELLEAELARNGGAGAPIPANATAPAAGKAPSTAKPNQKAAFPKPCLKKGTRWSPTVIPGSKKSSARTPPAASEAPSGGLGGGD